MGLSAVEQHLPDDAAALRQQQCELLEHKASLQAHHAAVEGRLEKLERFLGDTASRYAEAHRVLTAEHQRDAAACSANYASMLVRVSSLEQALSEALDRNVAELEALRATWSNHEVAHSQHLELASTL